MNALDGYLESKLARTDLQCTIGSWHRRYVPTVGCGVAHSYGIVLHENVRGDAVEKAGICATFACACA